ncbi:MULTISPECIES: hypothetical protein [unclassified Rhizobium]|uniref:hypothetical protein n=1 Tax=unclassified Rhizobium TaxID=2613769 RepID=UPI001ADAFE1A|nr:MULTISPECIES: hypothetical protein [unclassified Rhizobium]MBO9126998.1 hypothetical protein [Rhizobium sp. 16-488-2b]MBO9177445.1 hypothetical protein [Rhizobium sp. 16-488-2a]
MRPYASTILAILAAATPASAQSFGGNYCTDDCSGHKAGYEWAEQNSVTSEGDCSGNSSSFEEGCRTYLEDPSRGADFDDDGNEIDE